MVESPQFEKDSGQISQNHGGKNPKNFLTKQPPTGVFFRVKWSPALETDFLTWWATIIWNHRLFLRQNLGGRLNYSNLCSMPPDFKDLFTVYVFSNSISSHCSNPYVWFVVWPCFSNPTVFSRIQDAADWQRQRRRRWDWNERSWTWTCPPAEKLRWAGRDVFFPWWSIWNYTFVGGCNQPIWK